MSVTTSVKRSIDLTGKLALITGAAQGQGKETARIMQSLGAAVILTDLDEQRVLSAQLELGGDALSFRLDVRREDNWAACLAWVKDKFGRTPDVLVNNAAAYVPKKISEMNCELFDLHMDVNLRGALLGIQAIMPGMIEGGGGSIINISSIAGVGGFSGTVAYAASKWGLRGVTKVAAKELGEHNIRVNCILPGLIDTAMATNNSGARNDGYIQNTPLGRIGTSDEIGWMTAFLASELSSFTTGADIVIDGGLTLS